MIWIPHVGYMWLHFKLSLIIGDTEAHDKLCGHYCSYSSNIQRMCRDCDIAQCDGNDPHKSCQFVNVDLIKREVGECIPLLATHAHGTVGPAETRLQAISQLPVWSPFFDFDFCGCPHGVFGSCPFERLHAWQTGIMKDAMHKLFMLCDLPSNFLRWYNNKQARDSIVHILYPDGYRWDNEWYVASKMPPLTADEYKYNEHLCKMVTAHQIVRHDGSLH